MKKLNIVAVICAILFALAYSQCNISKGSDPRGTAFAGSKACAKCHSDVYHSYLHTAHYVASVPGIPDNVHGSFAKNVNVFNFSPSQTIAMEKLDSGLYQSYYLNGKLQERHRFDVVLGGIKGESYLYWKGNGLNQLPISYYTKIDKWLLSPRFVPGFVNFDRVISARCLECHASYIADQPDEKRGLTGAEQFDKTSLVYSVDCERCHGPGAQHIDFHTNNPEVKTAKYITSFSSLPRARKMDVCGVCHSGNKSQMLRSTFGFKPGDTLDNFKLPDFASAADTSRLDVHGNQVQLLESSKCFINSKMDCATCHDVHQNQRGNTAIFTQKCLSCHSTTTHNYCKMATPANAQLIKSNCIQCHMPALTSNAIISTTVDKASFGDILVHTHHIAVYPQQVKKILGMVKK